MYIAKEDRTHGLNALRIDFRRGMPKQDRFAGISLTSMDHLRRNVIVSPSIPAPVDSQTARDAVQGQKPLPSVAADRNEWKPYSSN